MKSPAFTSFTGRVRPIKSRGVWEFGDFQTPPALAEAVCKVVGRNRRNIRSVLEPCCGTGSFVMAAAAEFPEAEIIGLEIGAAHLEILNAKIAPGDRGRVKTAQSNFFEQSWQEVLATLPSPLLIVGNPPWVTSADLGKLQSKNLPQKANLQKLTGFEALTGKSNFDISEWLLLQHLYGLQSCPGTLAMLVKTTVARKILTHAWIAGLSICNAEMYQIDAMGYFGASVDACLLLLDSGNVGRADSCDVYSSLEAATPSHIVGYHGGLLIHDLPTYQRTAYLKGTDPHYTWRSGVKHDCSKVMELEKAGDTYTNGFDEKVLLEETYLYPLYKSSDVGHDALRPPRKHVLVTQRRVGDDTTAIAFGAPNTWAYLTSYQNELDARKSSIYRGRPRFSVFGVGDYTFAPWKVVISGLYKNLHFKVIAPVDEKPALVDDTINFLPCESEAEAVFVADLLNSDLARAFYSTMVFWDEKRPLTINLLKRLDLGKLAYALNKDDAYRAFAVCRKTKRRAGVAQLETQKMDGSLGLEAKIVQDPQV